MNKRYLGMDLSLSSPGFAVIALTDNNEPLILEASHVKTDNKATHGERLLTIQHELLRLIEAYEPFEAVVRERGFSRFPATTQTLFKVVGVTEVALAMSLYPNIEEIPPTTVKKLVAGSGKADKMEVERNVRKILRIDRADYFETDDESDAAAVVLAYLIQKGVIKR